MYIATADDCIYIYKNWLEIWCVRRPCATFTHAFFPVPNDCCAAPLSVLAVSAFFDTGYGKTSVNKHQITANSMHIKWQMQNDCGSIHQLIYEIHNTQTIAHDIPNYLEWHKNSSLIL